MSFISNDIKNGKIPGALFGLGVSYAYVGNDLMSLGIGAAVGFFAYPVVQKAVSGIAFPVLSADKRDYVLPAVLGGSIGYGVYFGDPVYSALGAVAGAAVEYGLNKY